MLNDVVWWRVGSDDAMTVLRDRSFMDQMKTDILRRVEAPSDSEGEEVNFFGVTSDHHAKGRSKVRVVAFDDDLEDVSSVRVAGDGEESSEDEDEEERDEEHETNPQTIVELAYIANPKVFERDAATRRSKERAALRAQTGALNGASLVKRACVQMTDDTRLP
jgi:activating signal cointegrator complex subunit 2